MRAKIDLFPSVNSFPRLSHRQFRFFRTRQNWAAVSNWTCVRCEGLDFVPHAVINDTAWNLFAYVGFSPPLASIVVSFRGTDSGSLYNWITDISSLRTGLDVDLSDSDDPDMQNSTEPILVHSGFFSAYNNSALKPGVRDAVADLVIQYGWGTPIAVSGHSLGGALASLCTLDLLSIYGREYPISSHTYGSPRVGNARFAEIYKYVHHADPHLNIQTSYPHHPRHTHAFSPHTHTQGACQGVGSHDAWTGCGALPALHAHGFSS